MYLSTSKIKPDPNQPRRTFNKEKMEALEASMKSDGFRKQYPIIINGGNIIVDGERRWRAAKKVGIKEVPIKKRKNALDIERLCYQLQSEGVQLEVEDKYEAWLRLYEGGQKYNPKKYTYVFWAKKLGVKEQTFRLRTQEYKSFKELKKSVGPTDFKRDFWTLGEIGKEKDIELRKKLAKKAVNENWQEKKAREIRRAIKEKPLRTKQILDQDYSDPFEGSFRWEQRLEVAKSDIDIDALEDMKVTRDKMFKQVDKWDQLMRSITSMRVAMDEFDFKLAPPEIRIKLHKILLTVLPLMKEYIKELEEYMLEKGELERNVKKLKGGK